MRFQLILNTIFQAKSSGGACPRTPLEGLTKFFLAAAWLQKFFQDRLPPKSKNPRQNPGRVKKISHPNISEALMMSSTVYKNANTNFQTVFLCPDSDFLGVHALFPKIRQRWRKQDCKIAFRCHFSLLNIVHFCHIISG